LTTITWNQQVVKRNNKSLVLQMIMEKEPISRADIAQVTGLNKGTVSSMVNELLKNQDPVNQAAAVVRSFFTLIKRQDMPLGLM